MNQLIKRRRIENKKGSASLEAFPVDNTGTAFVVLLLGDPHLLEGGEGGQDGTSNPDGVLPLGWSDDLDLHCGWSKSSYLFLHSVGDSCSVPQINTHIFK